jgi:hypothetical protein
LKPLPCFACHLISAHTTGSGGNCGGKADRFPAIVEAARAQSFLIDGEAVVCRPDGLSDFAALASLKENF